MQAKHRNNRAKVAIKVIYRDQSSNAQGKGSSKNGISSTPSNLIRELALRDKMADQKLSTHHMTKLIECIEEDQYVYLITSWMNRRDLCCYMKKHQLPYLSHGELKKPLKNIISALKAIHQAGYLHNDVQPCNILLEKKKG